MAAQEQAPDGPQGALLSEQVRSQQAAIRKLEAERLASIAAAATWAADEGSDSEDEEDDAEDDFQERLERLMASIVPCASACPAVVVQSSERQRVETTGGKWTGLKGLRLSVRPGAEDDCVLLVASCLKTPESDRESSSWTLQRAGAVVSPKFGAHCRQRGLSSSVNMAYLDQPGKRMELEYQVAAMASGGDSGRFMVSAEKQRRSLAAVTLPACQCAWVEDDERQVVEPGPWRDVDGFYEVATVVPGDKVLVLCSIGYSAGWASEMNRGRFTVVRDEVGLDGVHDRGLQSVRALGPGYARTLMMATVDEPPPGPHIYRVRTALTTGESSTGVTNILQGDRQLALVRLPGGAVFGPCAPDGPLTVDEDRWTEIPGMEVSVTLKRPRDKVLLVFHTDCAPRGFLYEAHFTILRRAQSSGLTSNLGFSEDFGIDVVSSDYAASSEYPAGLIIDTPGSVGPHTYTVAVRVANMGTSSDCPSVVVGHSGSLSAVLLSTR